MKKYIVMALLCLMSIGCFAQSMGVRFYDRQGREFIVYAPYGQFSYSMLQGDYVTRDYNGRVSSVGNTYISYNDDGQVISIGDVYLSYDYSGRLIRVGGLSITYDYNGNITHTSGRIR